MAETRPRTLAQAAAVVFVLVAVLPLLVFTWALYTLDVIHSIEAQLALALSVAIALLGFSVFRGMMRSLSESIRALRLGSQSKAAAQNGTRRPAPATPVTPAAPAIPAAPTASTAPTAPTAPAAPAARVAPAASAARLVPAALAAPEPSASGIPTVTSQKTPRRDVAVPAIGAVQEFSDLSAMMAGLWRDEAEAHLSQEVVVLLHSAFQPLTGRLTEVTDDGIVLEHNGKARAVSYRRISGIEDRELVGAATQTAQAQWSPRG